MYLNKSLKLKDMKKSEPDEKYKTKYFFLKKFIISLVYVSINVIKYWV